jgi:propanediol dehydratase small subunit
MTSMSLHRVVVGLLIGGCLVAAALAAVWHFDLPAELMPAALLVVTAVAGGLVAWTQRHRSLRPYWQRGCMGIRWRRRFPNDAKSAIREFLSTFTDAFAFSQRRRHRFAPEDRVMDIYRAVHPPGTLADNLELESLVSKLQRRYRIDALAVWRDDITLADLYEQTRRAKG